MSDLKECPNCHRENDTLLSCHLKSHTYCFWCAETIAVFLDECPICAKEGRDAFDHDESETDSESDHNDEDSVDGEDDRDVSSSDESGSSGGGYSSSCDSDYSPTYGVVGRKAGVRSVVDDEGEGEKLKMPISNDDRKKRLFIFMIFLLGILFLLWDRIADAPESFSFLPGDPDEIISSIILVVSGMTVLLLLSFKAVRKVLGMSLLILVAVVVSLWALFFILMPSYRFGTVTADKGQNPDHMSFSRVMTSLVFFVLITSPLVAVFIMREPLLVSLVEQVLFIIGGVGLAYMYFRTIRSYIKRDKPGVWHH